MPKKIIFCADGTWNHPHSPALVEDTDTNVYKLYKSLAYTSTQATFYDDGVGTSGNLLKHLIEGAFGEGLFQKIKDGYTAIAHVYEQDDPIYIFGFSRGAYTARSLAGMIAACGLPTRNFDKALVETAFEAYRHKDKRAALLNSLASCGLYRAKITCLGVWDTVGALGIPVDPLGIETARFGFLDTTLNPNVLNAYHAVSLDERRVEFPPTLWTPPFAAGQTVKQVWFAGVHCDVGGGYAQTGLSDITMSWMLNNAVNSNPANPLEIVDGEKCKYLKIDPKFALDTIHESWSPLWGFPRRRKLPAGAAISNSVQIRVTNDASYRPSNLPLTGNDIAAGASIEAVVSMPSSAAAAG